MQILIGKLVEHLNEAELDKLYRHMTAVSKTLRKVISVNSLPAEFAEFSA